MTADDIEELAEALDINLYPWQRELLGRLGPSAVDEVEAFANHGSADL